MSNNERKDLIDRIEKTSEFFASDKKAQKDFFVKIGIITADGKLTKPYENLCIPQEQA